MLGRINKKSRGDTLIEVLFAVSVFSLVAVGSLSIMNQGTATAERSLEITLVRQQIDAQAETLRYLNSLYIAGSDSTAWQNIQDLAVMNTQASDYKTDSCEVPPNVFVLNTHTASFVDPTGAGRPVLADTFSQVEYDDDNNVVGVKGIWIQPVSSPIGAGNERNAGYIDFHIRACWDSPGQLTPVALGTIVRLYEPRT